MIALRVKIAFLKYRQNCRSDLPIGHCSASISRLNGRLREFHNQMKIACPFKKTPHHILNKKLKTRHVFHSRRISSFPQLMPMNNEPIKEVSSLKHLGLFLSNDGKWHEHINYTTEKAWIRVNVMCKLKFLLDRRSLETIYISFIRPLLEYADVVWDNCTR